MEEFRRVRSLLELLNLQVSEVYVDSLTFRIIPELRTLTEHGVKVFYLRDLRLLRVFRDANKVVKSDENDARLLSLIPHSSFREVTSDFLRLRELVIKHHRLRKRVLKIRQWDDEVPVDGSKEYIAGCRREMERVEEEAHRIAVASLPLYKDVIGFIGMERSINVAELLTLLDIDRGFERLRRYTGHYSIPRVTRTGRIYVTKPKRYSHDARICLQSIAEHIIAVEMNHQKYGIHMEGRVWCKI